MKVLFKANWLICDFDREILVHLSLSRINGCSPIECSANVCNDKESRLFSLRLGGEVRWHSHYIRSQRDLRDNRGGCGEHGGSGRRSGVSWITGRSLGLAGIRSTWSDCAWRANKTPDGCCGHRGLRLRSIATAPHKEPITSYEAQGRPANAYNAFASSSANALCGPPAVRLAPAALRLPRLGGRWSATGAAVATAELWFATAAVAAGQTRS